MSQSEADRAALPNMRRIVRVQRLLAELAHADVVDALEELKVFRAALSTPPEAPKDSAPPEAGRWRARKAKLDAMDDGEGPYMHWTFAREPQRQQWENFQVWAFSNLGQGYSMACLDGSLLDEVTLWCFKGYCAGLEVAAPPAASDEATP